MKRAEMSAAAKFRATCDTCGKRQPRATTHWTSSQWMSRHEADHRSGVCGFDIGEGDTCLLPLGHEGMHS